MTASSIVVRSSADYLNMLLQLLPDGPAWPKQPGSVLSQVLGAHMLAASRMDARAAATVTEAFPSTTDLLLPEWETSLGLPDPCAGIAPTVAARQAQVLARFCATGGSSIAAIRQFAALLGYTITISQNVSVRAGVDAIDEASSAVADDGWIFHIDVIARDGNVLSAVLDCELRSILPAHVDFEISFGPALLDAFVLDHNTLW